MLLPRDLKSRNALSLGRPTGWCSPEHVPIACEGPKGLSKGVPRHLTCWSRFQSNGSQCQG